MVEADPSEPEHSESVFSLWKLFGFTGLIMAEALITRMARLFPALTTTVKFIQSSSLVLTIPSSCINTCASMCPLLTPSLVALLGLTLRLLSGILRRA